MDSNIEDNSSSEVETTARAVSFPQVCSVATGWMFDFVFVCLCRHFKDGNRKEFNELIKTLQDLSESPCLKDKRNEKTLICAFLSRVLHGKDLGEFFDEDESVTPLMSAFQIWFSLEQAVEDESLFKNITMLLLVQAVDVCLKDRNQSSPSSLLEWLKNSKECPRKLQVKLSTIVSQRDTNHEFLTSHSFSRLLETIATFLDSYFKRNPSDDLLKAATNAIELSDDMTHLDDGNSPQTISSTSNFSNTNKRTKRKLFSTKLTDLWKPDSCKKLKVSLKRIAVNELPNRTSASPQGTLTVKGKKRKRKMWYPELDERLMRGVERFGVGNWSQMLSHYDFTGRTGTMLKDRWRTLLKLKMVV